MQSTCMQHAHNPATRPCRCTMAVIAVLQRSAHSNYPRTRHNALDDQAQQHTGICDRKRRIHQLRRRKALLQVLRCST